MADTRQPLTEAAYSQSAVCRRSCMQPQSTSIRDRTAAAAKFDAVLQLGAGLTLTTEALMSSTCPSASSLRPTPSLRADASVA